MMVLNISSKRIRNCTLFTQLLLANTGVHGFPYLARPRLFPQATKQKESGGKLRTENPHCRFLRKYAIWGKNGFRLFAKAEPCKRVSLAYF